MRHECSTGVFIPCIKDILPCYTVVDMAKTVPGDYLFLRTLLGPHRQVPVRDAYYLLIRERFYDFYDIGRSAADIAFGFHFSRCIDVCHNRSPRVLFFYILECEIMWNCLLYTS